MKIAFFVSTFPQLSETFIVSQIAGLIDRGHDVTIYASEIRPESELHTEYRKYRMLECTQVRRSVLHGSWAHKLAARLALVIMNIWRHPIVVLRALNVFAYGRQAITLYVLDMAMRFIRCPSYDIVHCHFGANANDAAILKELGLLKGKLVATFHGYDIRIGVETSEKIYARVVKHCDAVHSISEYNQKWLEAFGFNRERIVYHPVGIDVGSFQCRSAGKNRADDETVNIVTVARLVEEKGLRYALEALAEVRRQRPNMKIKYKIIGGGPLERSLKTATTQLGLDEVVDFMGPQDQSVVRAALSQADLFVLPSVAEALPVSIMEAMASSLPVIATDVGSVAEMVRDGYTGSLVPAADTKALARALLNLLNDRESWPRLGAAARSLVEQKFDIKMLNNRLVEHYQSLLDGEPTVVAGAKCSIQ